MTTQEIMIFLRARHKNFAEKIGEDMLENLAKTILLLINRKYAKRNTK
mgnify:CR=1 FL=1|jgi:hypothetical protein